MTDSSLGSARREKVGLRCRNPAFYVKRLDPRGSLLDLACREKVRICTSPILPNLKAEWRGGPHFERVSMNPGWITMGEKGAVLKQNDVTVCDTLQKTKVKVRRANESFGQHSLP